MDTIDQLRSEVVFLREEVKIRDSQLSSYLEHDGPSCVDVDTPQPAAPPRSWTSKSAVNVDNPPPPRSWSPTTVAMSNRFAALSVEEHHSSDDGKDDDADSLEGITYANVTTRN